MKFNLYYSPFLWCEPALCLISAALQPEYITLDNEGDNHLSMSYFLQGADQPPEHRREAADPLIPCVPAPFCDTFHL